MLTSTPSLTRPTAAALGLRSAVPADAPDARPYSKRQQMLQELLKDSERLLKNRLEVRHLMSREPVVIPPTMTLEEMAALVQQQRVHHLIVCGRGGDVLGVVSRTDLRGQYGALAQQLMSRALRTVTPETPLGPAITHLLNEDISCLPVMDAGRLCGILTTTDLVLALQCTLQLWGRLARVLQHDLSCSKQLDAVTAGLEGELTAQQLADRIAKARQALEHQVQDLVNAVDLRADMLTELPNRCGLEEMLYWMLAVMKRHQQPFSLVVVAVDHFWQINESCGEEVTRPLLKAVARLIRLEVRESDYVARFRDDAFAVILPQTGVAGAETLCQRLQHAAGCDKQLDIELRIRCGAVSPEPGESMTQVLARVEATVA